MSASFEVRSSEGSYRVEIRSHAFGDYLQALGNSVIVADEFFTSTVEPYKTASIFVEAAEGNKSLDALPAIIEKVRRLGATRQTELVAIGGGIVQDLSAFTASVYMRGLAWSYLPTTLLAMVDSCIGGKSSINVGPYKNLVGTFHSPRQVLIDPSLAQTLPDDQKASGLIEAAKICFCRGAESFQRHMAFAPDISIDTDSLESIIVNSLASKKWFIEIDEFDKNERLLLNFGHTFGHAIEGASHFAISHGIAVGLGILCALTFARDGGANYKGAPNVGMLENHLENMVSCVPGLTDHLKVMLMDDVVERFASDKKHGADHYTLILVDEEGAVVRRKITKSPDVTLSVRRAVHSVIERFA